MRSRLTDRRIVLALVGALIFEIGLLLWHLGFISWGLHPSLNGEKPAGIVVKTSNELRRRSLNSLVWEKSAENESVFYYDSVLTLAQSTARLELEGGIEVELSENTLVTIEPREENLSAEIRLKFERGNLQARNPYRETKIEGSGFQVDLARGSELQLRQTGEREFEVQLKKGEAQVASGSGSVSLSEDGLLRIAGGKAQELKLDQDLKWQTVPERRIYTHESEALVALSWKGPATELRLQSLGRPEQVVPMIAGQSEVQLQLPVGHHLAYLRSGERTSTPAEVEVWRAPVLHLIMPLPRNRLRTAEQNTFLWTRIPEVSSYELRVDGGQTHIHEKSAANSLNLKFSDEDDALWGVWGIDKQGYLIPPLYKYPVYMRHEPLAAPKLFSPKLRQPASNHNDGASLWKWMIEALIPTAHADDEWEAYFAWEKVPGADRYVIEISESADFRNLVLSRETKKPEFVWSDYRKRVYYWRVAAGHSSGRMGVFSEPALVEETVEIRRPVKVAAVAPEELGPTKSSVVAKDGDSSSVSKPPEDYQTNGASPEKQNAAEPIVSATRVLEPRGTRVFWSPGFVSVDAKAKESVSAKLSGLSLISVGVEKDFVVGDSSWWTLSAFYSRTLFKPHPESEYPFQKDVAMQEGRLAATRMHAESHLGYGFSAEYLPNISRADFEEIKNESQAAAGAHILGLWSFDRLEYQMDFGLFGGSGLYGVGTHHRLLYPFMRDHAFFGGGVRADYILRGSYKTLDADAKLFLGFGF
jgi:hypothetical protein